MKNYKLYIFVLLIFAFNLAFIKPALSQSNYATDMVITNYDISLLPDFEKNILNVTTKTDMQNLSLSNIDKIDIILCTLIDTDDLEVEVENIFWLEEGDKETLDFSIKNIKSPFNPEATVPVFEVLFEKPLKPEEKAVLEFSYKIKGKNNKDTFPMKKGGVKELYLIRDFRWLPEIFETHKMGQFPNIYRSTWSLKLKYPSSYAAAVEGALMKRSENNGYIVEEWKSIIINIPQIFIAQYDVIKKKKGNFTLEFYLAKDKQVIKNAMLLEDDIIKILETYFDLYGPSGSTTFRLIASYTPWGAHGVYMGAVLDKSFFKYGGLNTLAHEMAHIWWGALISSYGEGSKFLREAMANFSAAWALRNIKGDEYFNNFLRDFKIGNFCYYITEDEVQKQYPLIMQESFNPRGIIRSNYRKGALVLNTLRVELGDEIFFECLRTFAKRFYDKNATMSDFIETVNSVSGKDMTPRFKELCWGTGYPIYRLIGFISTREKDRYKTVVTLKNEGEIAVLCPLMLKTSDKEISEWFKVEGKREKEFTFATENEVIDVVIDPDMIAFQYHPEQKMRLWEKFDESYFEARNWLWFNKSYAFYLKGKYQKAVNTLSQYLNLSTSINPEYSSDLLYCGYSFTRGFYHLALKDEEKAEKDIKLAVPFLFDSLVNKNIMRLFIYTGIIKEPEPEKQVISILNSTTHKSFLLEPELDEDAKKEKITEWKQWWEKEGKFKKLDLSGLYKWIKAPIQSTSANVDNRDQEKLEDLTQF